MAKKHHELSIKHYNKHKLLKEQGKHDEAYIAEQAVRYHQEQIKKLRKF